MNKIVKLMTAFAFAAIAHTLFAYNGGYENSLDYKEYPGVGYANNELTAREESGTTIDANRYAQCKKLTSVNLANVTSIGNAAFAYSALTSVELPANCSLGFISFGGCTNLASATINDTKFMTSADENKEPFRDCTALKTVTAKCAPPSDWDFKKVFPNVTTVRCPTAKVSQWKAKKYAGVTVCDQSSTYVIRYVKNDGTFAEASQIVSVGETKSLYYQSSQLGWRREGYKFCGWAKQPTYGVSWVNGQKVTDLTAAGKTISLYAVWVSESQTYTVKFHKNDGTSTNVGLVYPCGEERPLATQSSQLGWRREGYKFCGWAKQPTYGVSWVNAQKVKDLTAAGKTINLYAVWVDESQTYTIKFHKNDGTSTSLGLVYPCGEERPLATQSSQLGWLREGYKFCGWAKQPTYGVSWVNAQKVKDLTAAGKTINLYAVWVDGSKTYTIKFHKNDGTSTSLGLVYQSGVERPLATQSSQLGWRLDGYSFLGWSESQSAVTATWTNGQKVTDLAASGKTINLYAVWRKKSAQVVVNMATARSVTVSTVFEPGYYQGAFADGTGMFDLLLDEDGSAFFAARTEDGCWVEECEADQIGDSLVLTFEGGQISLRRADGTVLAYQ